MLGPDGDLVLWCLHHLSVLPILLTCGQTSLYEDVVEKDIYHDVVAGVDFGANFPAAGNDVPCVERQSCFAAPTLRFRLFLCDELSPPPPHTKGSP